MLYDSSTIDLGQDTTIIPAQHDLVGRLAQLADIADRGGFADDHVINLLVDRYRAHTSSMTGQARAAG
jgi:hypothetical protein